MVEHETIIIVGMTEEIFSDNFELPNDDLVDDFVDDFCIESDSWCGGQKFFALFVNELNEGEWCPLDEVMSASQRLNAIKKYREEMRKYGYDIPEYLITFYLVNQVF